MPIRAREDYRGGEVRLIGLSGVVLLILASHSAAQTWKMTTYLQPGVPLSCPKVNATYELTVSGNELAAKIPAGTVHRGPIAADGSVNIRYDSGHSRIGWITIAGDVWSRMLTVTASTSPSCLYALSESAPSDPPTAYAGSTGDWALGRWNGLQVRNVQGVGIQSTQYSLMIERQNNGKVFCRFNTPEVVHITLWATACRITSDTVDVTSGPIQLALQRLENSRLEGTTRTPDGSGIIRLTR